MKLFVLTALAAGPLLGTPAAAVPAPSAQRYVACVAQKHPATVQQLLRAPTLAAAQRPYHALSEDERCISIVFNHEAYSPQDVVVPLGVLRGRLAELALINSAAQVAALAALPLQQKRYTRPWFATTGRDPAVDEMGACIADTDPGNVLQLVRSAPATGEEDAAVGAIAPALTKCLSAGTRLQANRTALRAALAEALYQRLNNPALSTAPAPGDAKVDAQGYRRRR